MVSGRGLQDTAFLAMSHVTVPHRWMALDVARGLAVIGMIYVHLVPTEGAGMLPGRAATALAYLIEDKSAALFCILIGMSWSIQAQRAGGTTQFSRYFARRALALAVVGVVLHVTAWPTEILIPLALMMIPSIAIWRAGRTAIAVAAVLVLAATPVLTTWLGPLVVTDWTAEGMHIADASPGWATLRAWFFDGNYPVIPWIVFPLTGMLLVDGTRPRGGSGRVLWTALAVVIVAQGWALWSGENAETLGDLAPLLASTWVPTSVPFVVLAGSAAAALITALVTWDERRGLPWLATPVALLGRASLTHYILHILVVILPLRLAWSDEDWPLRVGVLAFAGYIALALPITSLWFRKFSHGPLEGLWAAASRH